MSMASFSAALDAPLGAMRLLAPVAMDEGTPLDEAVRRMQQAQRGAAVVCRGGRVTGIFTERDVLANCGTLAFFPKNAVETLMTPHPYTVREDMPLRQAVAMMCERGVRNLPLTDVPGRPLGILTIGRVTRILAEHPAFESGRRRLEKRGARTAVLETPVSELKAKDAVQVPAGSTVTEALLAMRRGGTGCVLAMEGAVVKGVFTDRDFLLTVAGRLEPDKAALAGSMLSNPDLIGDTQTVGSLLQYMAVQGRRYAPVRRADWTPAVVGSLELLRFLCR